MPGPYVEAAIPQSEEELKALGVQKLVELIEAEGITGYEPLPAYQEVMILAVAAVLFSNTAQIAAVVLPAIFRQYGTELIKLAFNEGASATVKTIWTVVPSEGVRTIEAGTQIEAGGLGFRVEANTEVKAKATSVELQVVAVARGSEYNKVSGEAKQVNPYDWVTTVELVGETTGGAEQETDSEYLGRLAAQLQLQAPRPVNAADFAPFILGVPSSILPAGVVVGRATAIDLYDAETSETNVGNCCTTWVTGPEGEALTSEQNEALQAWVRKYTPFGFLAFVRSPVYEQIYCTVKIHVSSKYAAASVVANVKAAIEALLSKKTWGNPEKQTTGATAWLNETKVRYNTIVGVIESVPGVEYCYPAGEGLKTGTAPTPAGTIDITLSGGPVVLPTTTGAGIIVTSE